MQQDFRASNSRPRRHYTGLVLIIIAAALLIPAGMLYVKYRKTIHNKDRAKSMALSKPIKKISAQQVKNNNGTPFDFYSLLPKMNAKEQNNASTTTAVQASYVLQVASTKDPDDITALRNKLGALGITAYIQKAPGNSSWYRVLAGPYASTSVAKQDQQRLRQQHINSLLIKSPSIG